MARGGLLRGSGLALGVMLTLVSSAILIRTLGVGSYGGFILAITLATFAATLADLGVGAAVSRMVAFVGPEERVGWARAGGRISAVSGAVASIGCVAIALSLHGVTRTALLIASPAAFAITVRLALAGALMAERRLLLVEGSLAAYQVISGGVAISLAAAGVVTAGWATFAQVLGYVVALGILVPAWLRLLRRGAGQATPPVRSILSFSLPLLLAALAWTILQRSDVILLGLIRGTAAVGTYNPVLRIADLGALALAILGSYYVPIASGMLAGGRIADLRFVYATTAKWGVVLVSPLLAVLIISPSSLLVPVFGPSVAGMGAVARVLAAGYAVNVLAGNNALTLTVLGKTRAIAIRSIAALGANLVLNLILIPRFGALGAAGGTAITYTALNVANSMLIWRTQGIHPFRRDYVLVVCSAALSMVAAAALSTLIPSPEIWRALAIAGCVAGGTLLAFVLTATADERAVALLILGKLHVGRTEAAGPGGGRPASDPDDVDGVSADPASLGREGAARGPG